MHSSELEQIAADNPSSTEITNPNPGTVDVLDLLIILARGKKLIATVTVSATTLALVISLLIPNRYTATTTILPPQQTQSTAAMLMNQLAGTGLGSLAAVAGGSLGLRNANDLYIGMLKSRTVQDGLIHQFDFQDIYSDKRLSDARKDFEKYSNISSGKDGLMNISFEDKDPKRAAAVANAYVDQLRNMTQRLAVTEASQRRLFFEQQLQQAKDDLSSAEVALKDTQQKTGMIQFDSQAKAVIEAIGTLRGQIVAKEVQLQAMRSFATDENPDYVLAEQQLAGLRNQLGKLEKQQPSDAGDPLLTTSKVPGVALEYLRRVREVKYREALFDALAKQYEAAKLDEAKEATVIQVVDRAVPPDQKSSPHRVIIIAFAIVCGLLLGMILALCAEAIQCLRGNHRAVQQLSQLKFHMGGKN